MTTGINHAAGSSGATIGVMEKRTGNWTPDRRTERAALRRDFENLTPGQRVEQAIILSRELTSLAARRAART